MLDDTKKKLTKVMPKWFSLPLFIIMVFMVFMMFFGENSYLQNRQYVRKIEELKAEIKSNEDSTDFYERKKQELNTDRETLERIAREQYGMKKANEEVYKTDIP